MSLRNLQNDIFSQNFIPTVTYLSLNDVPGVCKALQRREVRV